MAQIAPVAVQITCPACGQIENAQGQVSLYSSTTKGKTQTQLSYSANVDHDCPDIEGGSYIPPA